LADRLVECNAPLDEIQAIAYLKRNVYFSPGALLFDCTLFSRTAAAPHQGKLSAAAINVHAYAAQSDMRCDP
jgi:hypothetical protein